MFFWLNIFIFYFGKCFVLRGSFLLVKGGLLVYWFIWARGTLLRVHYGQLMELISTTSLNASYIILSYILQETCIHKLILGNS